MGEQDVQTEQPLVTVACRAMATRFEIALWGGAEPHLRAAGEEALQEIELLDAQLSLYRDDSDVRDINVRAAHEPVLVEPRVFRLLLRARALWEETKGAFDITVGPLLRAWGFLGGSGSLPTEEAVEEARACTGMQYVELDEEAYSIRFLRPGMMIDLGAIGKGYGIERAAAILEEVGVGGALIHGGTSTVQALGAQPDGSPWPVAIRHPFNPDERLAVACLRDGALSVSAVHGKAFTEGDTRYGHVLDPRSGRPVQGAVLAAVTAPSATDTDALSTGLLVLGEAFVPTLAARPATGALAATPRDDGALAVVAEGMG